MSERMLSNSCDDDWNPNLLLYCDQSQNGLPFRTQFKIAGSVPLKYGIQVGVSFQSLPGYLYRHLVGRRVDRRLGPERRAGGGAAGRARRRQHGVADHRRRRATTPPHRACRRTSARSGQLVDPGITQASLSVPLVAPMTEYGDRINQLDVNITKSIKWRNFNIQPKLDVFNALNRAPVTAVLGLNYGTVAYKQPSVVLNPRTIQIGANVRF